jgi:hypothetical protein
MGWLSSIFEAIGAVVDKLVPVAKGQRTKIAVIACPLLSVLAPLVSQYPAAAPFLPLIPALQGALCAAAPAFALAGLVRK